MMHFGNSRMGFGGGYLMMCVMTAAIAVLVILGILALLRYIRASGPSHRIQMTGSNANTALQILNERYAKGELADDEYKTKKAELAK